ncbi:winged helix-turn-helix domain-containing protein [Parvularcula lutaonensis]|uniref:Winged helix-turn-helix domain-containing protein n=1 Tax=Parvularcula lutaonensis TaxID=491923 RepID=A0ABV7MB75_9PROT|nr:transcriptional regulator [Parvularcula lutaonensis]GGY46911.1 transcriptional regulator [Parvularcula lutaonensis]
MSEGFDAGRLDDAIHGRLRLGIMAYLSQASPATFNELKETTGATGGNLSTHLRKLEDAGYIEQVKSFEGRKPLTTIHLTDKGRAAFADYLDALKPLLGG